MALDPNNPALPQNTVAVTATKSDPEFIASQNRLAAAAEKQAAAATQLANAALPAEATVTESGVYFRILLACISARLGGTSDEMQVWATDLTRDYLAKYPLTPPQG